MTLLICFQANFYFDLSNLAFYSHHFHNHSNNLESHLISVDSDKVCSIDFVLLLNLAIQLFFHCNLKINLIMASFSSGAC